MNIFVLDLDPVIAAKYHCDKHVVKMILESAQMLSTVHRLMGSDIGYKATHVNHPCTKWVCESLSNYRWLRTLSANLHAEWLYRFRHDLTRQHKSYQVICELHEPEIPDNGLTPFELAMPDEFKRDSAVAAYRLYYRHAKSDLHVWSRRPTPWFI